MRTRTPNCNRHTKKLQKLAADPAIDLWATDEVHFQQYGSACRMWVPRETRCPVLLHPPTRKSVGYFGAVRLRDGKFLFRRETERFHAVTCWQFLKELRARSAHAGRKVVVIVDNAKYHHARMHRDWRQAQADHFILDFLPPYSPDLNPIERGWKLTRRLAVHNRYFPHLDDVVLAVETQCAQWKTANDILRKLCAII